MITISHTYVSGTIVTGTRKGDIASEILRRHGLRWSRNIGPDGAWYVRRSREKTANRPLIELARVELAEAGYEIQVAVDDTPRPGEVEAARHARVEDRMGWYEQAADRTEAMAKARLDKIHRSRVQIPPGQPITSDRFAAYLTRLVRSERIGTRHLGRAEHFRGRAEAAAVHQAYRNSPTVVLRRIERLESELRRAARQIERLESDPYYVEHPEMRGVVEERLHARKATLEAQLVHWRGELDTMIRTDRYRLWKPRHFRLGDEICVSSSAVRWLTVLRVNRRSLTVALPDDAGTPADARANTSSGLASDASTEGRTPAEKLTVRVSFEQVWAFRRDGQVFNQAPLDDDAATDVNGGPQ